MLSGFTKGLIVGSLIGTSIIATMGGGMMNNRMRYRMMKNGRRFMRRAGHFVNNVVDVIR